MQIEGLSELQRSLADSMWELETLDDVHKFINSLPKQLRIQARTVLEMMTVAAVDEMIADDDLGLANAVIDSVK